MSNIYSIGMNSTKWRRQALVGKENFRKVKPGKTSRYSVGIAIHSFLYKCGNSSGCGILKIAAPSLTHLVATPSKLCAMPLASDYIPIRFSINVASLRDAEFWKIVLPVVRCAWHRHASVHFSIYVVSLRQDQPLRNAAWCEWHQTFIAKQIKRDRLQRSRTIRVHTIQQFPSFVLRQRMAAPSLTHPIATPTKLCAMPLASDYIPIRFYKCCIPSGCGILLRGQRNNQNNLIFNYNYITFDSKC